MDWNIPSNCNKLYIDVGLSSEAIQSQSWLEQDPNIFVLGFEPSFEARGKIFMEYRSDHRWLKRECFPRIRVEECALSNPEKETSMTFYRPGIDVGCSSLLKPRPNSDGVSPQFNGVKEAYQVRVVSLKEYFNKHDWLIEKFKRIEYIKIDAQGSDLNIIKGGLDLIKEKVVWITAEGDGGYYKEDHIEEKDRCSADNIRALMKEIGFIERDHPNTTDPTFYNPKWVDFESVFINQY